MKLFRHAARERPADISSSCRRRLQDGRARPARRHTTKLLSYSIHISHFIYNIINSSSNLLSTAIVRCQPPLRHEAYNFATRHATSRCHYVIDDAIDCRIGALKISRPRRRTAVARRQCPTSRLNSHGHGYQRQMALLSSHLIENGRLMLWRPIRQRRRMTDCRLPPEVDDYRVTGR